MTIKDIPRFEYRGFMFDCCRHFFGKDQIKQFLDVCALHKLSVFHWHLTEDQGWRIQIEKYPKLTEIGSKRAETRGDGVPHSGFFSKADVKEIVDYAAKRYIEVIPEIDMPGHMRAAIAAYPELGCAKKSIDVATRFGVHTEILCGGRDSTYQFIYDVLDEVAEMFPSKFVHLGGDEAPKIEWRKCPDCQKKVEEEGLASVEQLQGYLTNKALNHLKKLGKVAICWNESLHGGNLGENAVIQYWMGPSNGAESVAAANAGRKIIVSKFKPYYLDYPYGMTPLKATYKFEPKMPGFTETGAKNILGVESPLWTEYVENFKQIEYQTFPRLTALSETGWTLPKNKNYKSFMERLPNMKGILSKYGITVVSDKEANPNFFKGKYKTLKFFINLAKPEDMARQRAVWNDTKAMRKEQKEVGKK
jgi:N-acetyl-beta-hexosaminidase